MKIYSLQYLRAFASIWVLFTHVLQQCYIKPNGIVFAGQWGVDIFFLLSGFIIYTTTKETMGWRAFAIKRIFRIFPAYWSCLLLYMGYDTLTGGGKITHLTQNILMMPWDGSITPQSLYVGQAWSTCYELYFYFLLGILLFLKLGKKYIAVAIIGLFGVGYIINHTSTANSGPLQYIGSLIGLRHVFFFIEGVIISMIWSMLEKKLMGISKRWIVTFAVACAIFYTHLLMSEYSQLYSFVLSPLVFITVLTINRYVISESFTNKVFTWLGDISYSIYIVHLLIINIVIKVCAGADFWVVLSLSILLTILSSAILYKYVEKPFIEKGRKLSLKWFV